MNSFDSTTISYFWLYLLFMARSARLVLLGGMCTPQYFTDCVCLSEEIRPLLCNGIRYPVIRPSVPISYVLAERVEYIKDIFGRARNRKLARRAGRTSRTPCSSVSHLHA
jgi:hypothetical protein